ncbi:sugar phosphate isomerase/epimerase family protein [Christensenella intestinihominis]|uniref:sugar phosphate isomerase/epimerase family protein n=1 Tax=Christensenella intestinihominis TaxID=1851429 RepID=UPI00083060C5|nr:TIM barrel protein [Christensenella intestinihominis]
MYSTIGVSTWSLQQLTFKRGVQLPEMIEMIARMGVDGLDLYEEYLPVYPDTNLAKLNEIKKMAKNAGLPIFSTWFFVDPIGASYSASLEWTTETVKKFIAVTASLGAKYLALPTILNIPGVGLDEAYDMYERVYEKLVPIAEEYDVRLAAEVARQHTPSLMMRLQKSLKSDYFTICPDFEAWRVDTPDIPLIHQETPGAPPSEPETIETFTQCLPYSPYIHAKLLSIDENGEEPHFPIHEMMKAIGESEINHHLCIEYEGWIPDIRPEDDAEEETRKCVELLKKYRKK